MTSKRKLIWMAVALSLLVVVGWGSSVLSGGVRANLPETAPEIETELPPETDAGLPGESGDAVGASGTATAEKITVVIDPGHGGMDSGTVSKSGLYEKDVNLAVSLHLRDMLTAAGFSVVMTRESDVSIHDEGLTSVSQMKRSDLKNRLEVMKASGEGLFLSIHQNAFTQSQYHGAQVFYHKQDERNAVLAGILQKSFIELLQPNNTRVEKQCSGEYYLLLHADRPAVLVECGFLSNAEEAALLGDEGYQRKVAFVVFTSVMRYYETEPSTDSVIQTESEN